MTVQSEDESSPDNFTRIALLRCHCSILTGTKTKISIENVNVIVEGLHFPIESREVSVEQSRLEQADNPVLRRLAGQRAHNICPSEQCDGKVFKFFIKKI